MNLTCESKLLPCRCRDRSPGARASLLYTCEAIFVYKKVLFLQFQVSRLSLPSHPLCCNQRLLSRKLEIDKLVSGDYDPDNFNHKIGLSKIPAMYELVSDLCARTTFFNVEFTVICRLGRIYDVRDRDLR